MAKRKPGSERTEGPGLFDGASASGAPDTPDAPGASGAKRPAAPRPAAPKPAPTPEQTAAPASELPVWTVAQLTREVTGRLAALGRLAVEGEITGLKRAASGHLYFDLKGEGARISCAVWRSQVKRALRFELAEGMQVVAHGRLDVYAPRGSYSLIVERLEQRGIGALLAQLEQLKAELRERGWFDRHRPLPVLPRRVGIVTSRDGAALRDFLKTRSARWPLYPVRLVHSPVQGPGTSAALAEAVDALDASGVDVIVVTRGGGSLEDLWAFNERPLAEAIRRASVPVVSAVGHESDTSLSDLVADWRAHTPTDAAQTVIPDREELVARMRRAEAWLADGVDRALSDREGRLVRAARSRVLKGADWMLRDREQALGRARERMRLAGTHAVATASDELRVQRGRLEAASPAVQIERWSRAVERSGERLARLAERALEPRARRMEALARTLDAVSPLKVLGLGYSITSDQDGRALTSSAGLAPGDGLVTRLGEGSVRSAVTHVERESEDGEES